MKKILLLVLLSLIASCSGNQKRAVKERKIASIGCSLVKHPTKDHWQVYRSGRPYNKYWYTKVDAFALKSKIEGHRKCR